MIKRPWHRYEANGYFLCGVVFNKDGTDTNSSELETDGNAVPIDGLI
jgi:hypothetical protein